jgi:hypothetical protein
MYSPFEEMSWPQFMSQPHLKKLSLQEQVAHYNQYLFELTIARQSWIEYQNKGPIERYLAQEESYNNNGTLDYYLILQEDGSKIIIT